MRSDGRPRFRAQVSWLALLASLLSSCGPDAAAPGPPDDAARRAAAALDELADSVAGTSDGLTAEALRHAADLVRLAGTTTTVTLLIDGQPETWSAIAEQLDTPMYACPAPDGSGGGGTPDDSTVVSADPTGGGSNPGLPTDCEPAGTYTMRTLLAWSSDFARVVRLVADPGATPSRPDVPDVMGGTPPTRPDGSVSTDPSGGGGGAPGDSGGAAPPDTVIAEPPIRYPGFMGEYLVSGAGMWWATEGAQENELLQQGGACTDARPTLDWAVFECSVARIGFRFTMRVEALRWEPLTGTADPGDLPPHDIAMAPTEVDGVRLLLVEWRFPEPPSPEPLPPGEPPPPPDSVRPDGTGDVRRET